MNTQNKDIYTILALVFSSLSIAIFCFFFLSPVFASLGITFAFFSKRIHGKLSREAFLSMIISFISLFIFWGLFFLQLPSIIEIYNSQDYQDFLMQLQSSLYD